MGLLSIIGNHEFTLTYYDILTYPTCSCVSIFECVQERVETARRLQAPVSSVSAAGVCRYD